MDLIETLSFGKENESELDRKRALLDTLDFVDRLEERSDGEEVNSSSLVTKRSEEFANLDYSIKSRIVVESEEEFCLAIGQSLFSEMFYFFSHSSNSQEQFQAAADWILGKLLSGDLPSVYFYASQLDVLFYVTESSGKFQFCIPRSFLSLRKYLARFLDNFTIDEDISQDREFSSSLEFVCDRKQATAILTNFSVLSQRDAILDITCCRPFIYATIMPNEIGFPKKTRRILQTWNEETHSAEVVESVSYSQCLSGQFFGDNFVARLIDSLPLKTFKMRLETVTWSSFGRSICTVEKNESGSVSLGCE